MSTYGKNSEYYSEQHFDNVILVDEDIMLKDVEQGTTDNSSGKDSPVSHSEHQVAGL
jgi:hypothetical protein